MFEILRRNLFHLVADRRRGHDGGPARGLALGAGITSTSDLTGQNRGSLSRVGRDEERRRSSFIRRALPAWR